MIKKMLRLLTSLLFTFVFVIAVSSCATSSVSEDKGTDSLFIEETVSSDNIATLQKYDNAMFWEVDGTDKNGESSKLYVLGTIHVGDDRLYPLPDFVEEAYLNSDRVVSELASDDWENIVTETVARQMLSAQAEADRVALTGKPLMSYLTEDEINCLVGIFGNIDMVNALTIFEPWVLNTALSSIPIQLSGLNPEKGIDNYFIQKSAERGISVEGLDTLDTQFDVMAYGDWETQLAMLKEVIDEFMQDPSASGKELNDLYEAYLTFDDNVLNELMSAELDEESEYYGEDYNNALFLERNTDWAEKFNNYLLDGGNTFIFAGSGHFVGNDSVFNIMKKNNTLR